VPHHRSVVEIILPEPSLVVLIGAAGSGKSTFAARHFAPTEVLSSDRYRAILAGDEADQSVTKAAFARLHRDLTSRLLAGVLTVVDATNVEPSARRALLVRARTAGVPALAIVLDLPDTIVLARNAARRPRTVDESVIHRHLARLRRSLDGPGPGLGTEGFAAITTLHDPTEVDQVVIRRDPGPLSPLDR